MFFDHNENKLNESIKSIVAAFENDFSMLFRDGNEILSKEDFNDTAKRCMIMIEGKEKSFIDTSNMYMQFIRARNRHNKLYIKDRGELKLVCLNEEKYKTFPTCVVKYPCPVSGDMDVINKAIKTGKYDKDVYIRFKKINSFNSKYMNYYRCAISGAKEMREIKSSEFSSSLLLIFDLNNENKDMVKANFYKKKITSEVDYNKYMSETYMISDYTRVKDFIKEVKENLTTLSKRYAVKKDIQEIEKYKFMCNYLTAITQYYLIILDNILFAYTLKMNTRKKALDETFERNK